MPTDVHNLTRLVPVRDLGRDNAEIIARAWTGRHLRAGDLLWEQDTPAPDLGLLLRGELIVTVDGEEIGRVRAGDVIGETSAFGTNARRSASLQAVENATVLLLNVYDLQRLVQAFPAFHEKLLARCLQVLARRIRATDLRIAKLSHGVLAAPQDKPATGLTRLWKALRSMAGVTSRPPLLPLLSRLPGLTQQPPPVLDAIGAAFQARGFDKGELIAKEGEAGDAAFLLAAGEVQALRHVRNRMAELLVTFQPGGLFGTVTLPTGGPRTATCRAASAGWLYAMDAQAYEALEGAARLAWTQCLVVTQGIQLRNANALLAGFQAGTHQGGPLSDQQYERLLATAGALEGVEGG